MNIYSYHVPLIDVIDYTYIVAYKEDCIILQNALKKEGFLAKVVRPQYSPEELGYSRQYRCLLNHINVWKIASASKGLTLVVEADFVPVIGFGKLPLPFDYKKMNIAIGYLYAGGATVFDLDENGFARGHCSCTVAYIISPNVAQALLKFAATDLEENNPTTHSLWDCRIRMSLQDRGIYSWMPFRQYGEHGGKPNPEHARAGINPSHQADVLWNRLHFLPQYAEGSMMKFVIFRWRAKFRGLARLLFGRYLTAVDLRRARVRRNLLALLKFTMLRLISFY